MTRSIFAAFVIISSAHAEESRSYHYIRVPSKDAAGLRQILSSEPMLHNPKAVSTLLKGAADLATFKDIKFEGSAPYEGIEITGAVGLADKERDLEVKLRLSPGADQKKGLINLSSFAEEPLSKKTYRGYSANCSQLNLPKGRWLELANWARENDTVMLWTYNPDDPNPTAPESLRIDVKFCLGTPADIELLKKAPPETREKAVKWILGRAKVHRESAAPGAIGQMTRWEATDTRLEAKDGSAYADQQAMLWECKLTRQDTKIESTWKISQNGGSKNVPQEAAEQSITLSATPQVWDYAPIHGGKEFNLMIFKFSNL